MREVQLYINNKRVDLYGDEKIQITSSIQNIQDISKVFTDFSQTFTVPASDNNNDIFDYFYNNDFDGTFQAQERADARIEINNIPFRRGKIQLEGSEIKNNNPESYKITFYGDVVSLKDLFGTLKLSDLDYSSIAFAYTGTTVNHRIQTVGDLDVRFPLISSDKVWTYGDSGANDISLPAHPISYTELFPAVKDKAIIDIIQTQFGVTFNSNFFDGDYFKNSFTWWKNSETVFFSSPPTQLLFNDSSANSNLVSNEVLNVYGTPIGDFYDTHELNLTIATSPTASYFVDVYKNGALLTTIDSGSSTSGTHQIFTNVSSSPSLNDTYTFEVRTYNMSAATTVTGSVQFVKSGEEQDPGTGALIPITNVQNAAVTIAAALEIQYNFNTTAPDITVSDWFSGILKMFNLTCYPIETATHYKVEPLMAWYLHGGEINITEYTDVESIKVDRPKLYKEISFEYEQSKAFLNEEFRGRVGYNYGDLSLGFSYDGQPFKVKLPFENMQFTKFSSTNLQVSYALDSAENGKPYVPKPVKLFMDESKAVSFRFNDGSSTFEATTYMPFGQDQVYNTMNFSQNFGLEFSTLKEEEIPLSLYATFYQAYITNLFDPKTRKVTVKCRLPLPVLTTLTLDDSILLRDKRYSIETMKTDLTSGDVELVLLSDFNRPFLPTIPDVPPGPITGPKSIALPIKMIKPPNPTKQFGGGGGYITLSATVETAFVSLSIKGGAVSLPLTLSADTILDIELARNTTGSARNQTIPVTYYDASGTAINTSFIFLQQV